MTPLVISDTSGLIALDRIDQIWIELIKLEFFINYSIRFL